MRRRLGRLAGAAIGVALATALVAALLDFIGGAARSMTVRAVESVPVDWQVQLAYGADAEAAMDAIRRATPVSVILPVLYADVADFNATSEGTTQTTGAGKAVGLPGGYEAALPGQIRLLLGSLSGPLLAQQTAANLHATVGSRVTIDRPGVGPVDVVVAGVVDLPNQDSMFQRSGCRAEPNRRRRPTMSSCCRPRTGAPCLIRRPRLIRPARDCNCMCASTG